MRVELESYLAQLEAVPYDLPADDIPTCLDWSERKYIVNLIEELNPVMNAIFERCDTTAKAHGVNEELDYNSQLFDLKMMAGETGYYIGVLAGVMFAGASKDTVDRFERGLFYAMKSNNRVVKDARHD